VGYFSFSGFGRVSGRRLLGPHGVLHHVVLVLGGVQLLLDLGEADVGHGVVAVEDARNLLEGRALGLDVDEVDPDELERVPELRSMLVSVLLIAPARGGRKGPRTV